jgi:hypothetical protein
MSRTARRIRRSTTRRRSRRSRIGRPSSGATSLPADGGRLGWVTGRCSRPEGPPRATGPERSVHRRATTMPTRSSRRSGPTPRSASSGSSGSTEPAPVLDGHESRFHPQRTSLGQRVAVRSVGSLPLRVRAGGWPAPCRRPAASSRSLRYCAAAAFGRRGRCDERRTPSHPDPEQAYVLRDRHASRAASRGSLACGAAPPLRLFITRARRKNDIAIIGVRLRLWTWLHGGAGEPGGRDEA